MLLEVDAEHVVALPLQPVRRLPQLDRTAHPRVAARDRDLDAQPMVAAERLELIDDFEPRLAAQPVHRRHIDQKVKAEVGLVAQRA